MNIKFINISLILILMISIFSVNVLAEDTIVNSTSVKNFTEIATNNLNPALSLENNVLENKTILPQTTESNILPIITGILAIIVLGTILFLRKRIINNLTQ